MSKVDDLIKELCPQGVEWKALKSVTLYIRGITYKKSDESTKGTTKILRGNNITLRSNIINFNNVKTVSENVRVRENQWLRSNDILISAASGSKTHVGKVAYIEEDMNYCFGAFMAVIRVVQKEINSRFLFHLLIGNTFSDYLDTALSTSTINNLSASIMNAFTIPIPPLPVQEEIVTILDTFTQLEAELEAELEARKKQYEYYRNTLLNPNDKKDIEVKPLSSIANYSDTRIKSSTLNSHNYIGVDNLLQNRAGKTISNYVPNTGNLTCYKENDILIGNIRPYLKKIWHSDQQGGTNGDVLVICIKQEAKHTISSRYLYQILAADDFFYYAVRTSKGAKMPRGNKQMIMKYKIPIPPLKEQARIVAILDKFDALVNDISSGLPAEIKARRQQYEHYRNKLLSFKERD